MWYHLVIHRTAHTRSSRIRNTRSVEPLRRFQIKERDNMTKNIFLLFVLGLVGCSSGGSGSGSSGPAGPTAFKQWSQVTPKSTVQAAGGFTYVSGYSAYQSPGGALVTATLDANRYISILTLQTPLSSISFNTANGDTISSSVYSTAFVAYNKAQTTAAIFANPYAAGWEYQTFGVWGGYGNFSVAASSNAASVGSATPASGMPTAGIAMFSGVAGGIFATPSGASYLTTAAMAASVDFGSRVVGFATRGTVATSTFTTLSGSAPALDLTGRFAINAGTSQFSGPVVSAGGMTGGASGQFYGPNANEIGGSFGVANASIGAMIGGFGGRR